jgi:hypothetical protein
LHDYLKKFMRKYLFILLCLFCTVSNAQNKKVPATLSSAAMVEDFNYLRQILETTAPGLYAHQSPERVKQIFDSLKATLSEPLPFLAFYSKIAFMIAELHCEHAQALPAGSMADELFGKFALLPIQPDFTGPHPIVIINGTKDTSFAPGDEILTINGRAITDITRELYQYLPGDGFITTSKAHTLSSMNFGFFYNIFIEQPKKYQLVIKKRDGRILNLVLDKELGMGDINKNAMANPVNKRVFELAKISQEKRKEQFKLEFVPEKKAAFLTVRTFGVDKQPFETRIDSFFRLIEQNGVKNLVIDLSYNDGGEEERAAYLLSYLATKTIPFVESEYLLTDKDEYLAMTDAPKKILKNKYDYIEPLKDGKSMVKISEYSMELAPVVPKPGRFTGKTFLYVNGGTASSASTFTALAQFNKLATIVGEETSGSYKGGGVVIGVNLKLPNSDIRTHSSISFMNFATGGRNGSRGTIPDHFYVPTFEDIIAGGTRWREVVMGLF